MRTDRFHLSVVGVLFLMALLTAQAQFGGFVYQGFLRWQGEPANGVFDFRFVLYDAASGGTQQGTVQTHTGITVTNGLFTQKINLSAPFNGGARWLEIRVKLPTDINYTVLTPRVEITPTPYAMFAASGSATLLQNRPLSSAAPLAQQVLKWDGAQWLPMVDNDTQYAAGNGLQLVGNTFRINPAGAQNRHALIWDSSLGQAVWGLPAASSLRLPFAETVSDPNPLLSITNTGAGEAGKFVIDNTSNNKAAVQAETRGVGTAITAKARGTGGSAGFFDTTNTANNSAALFARTVGTGAAFVALTTGTGDAGYFDLNAPMSNANAIFARTNGGGAGIQSIAVHGLHTGAEGYAGYFEIDDPNIANPSPALRVRTNAAGNAGYFQSLNPANVEPALRTTHWGSGTALQAMNTGGGSAGEFFALNPLSPMPGVEILSMNLGNALQSISIGNGGSAGHFEILDPTNANPSTALVATTNAMGSAGFLRINHAANPSDALSVMTDGMGTALFATSTGLGRVGWFFLDNASNGNNALEVSTNGTGRAGMFSVLNAGSNATAMEVLNIGTGRAGSFVSVNPTTNNSALYASTNGNGAAVHGNAGNGFGGTFYSTSGAGSAIYAESNSAGSTMFARMTGSGYGAFIQTNSTTNNNTSLVAMTDGLGGAASFEVSNVNATSIALATRHFGRGTVANLAQLNNAATGHTVLATNVGSGNAVMGFQTSATTGRAGEFQIPNPNSRGVAVYGYNNGNDGALGVARAGEFQINNVNNGSPAVAVFHRGLGRAGNFQIDNTASAELALFGFTRGLGRAGVFQINNNANGDIALYSLTNGTGSAAAFVSSNGASFNPAVQMFSNGFGEALVAVAGLGDAATFQGDVMVNGTLNAWVKMFKIDHPLDPANRYLNHVSIESSEMMNLYSGNVVLNAQGEAWVQVPEWFEAVNTDYRYQLTSIGGAAPSLHIAQELAKGRFKIAGGLPGKKVSWQVTAVRNDPYARAHPVVVEQMKGERERGRYLNPALYGKDPTERIGYIEAAPGAVPAQPAGTPSSLPDTPPAPASPPQKPQ